MSDGMMYLPRWSPFAVAVLMALAGGCARTRPAVEIRSSRSAESSDSAHSIKPYRGEPERVEAELRGIFGRRLGRVTLSDTAVAYEVEGDATEQELLLALLAFSAHTVGPTSRQATALFPDDGWAFTVLQWDEATGRLSRWIGEGGGRTVDTYVGSEGVPLTAFRAGEVPSGVDVKALELYATGKEAVAWEDVSR